jgi:uncharacterized protein HemY
MRIPRYIFVQLAAIVTAVWLARSAYEILGSGATFTGKLNLTVIALVGAVVIMGLGFFVQWAVDRIRTPRRRRDDTARRIDRRR